MFTYDDIAEDIVKRLEPPKKEATQPYTASCGRIHMSS